MLRSFQKLLMNSEKNSGAAPEVLIQSPVGGLSAVRFQGPGIAVTSDAILSCFLIPAINAGKEIVLPSAPSPKLRAGLPQLMQTLASWDSRLSAVDVRWAPNEQPLSPRKAKRGVGCFFSGGVDSFF